MAVPIPLSQFLARPGDAESGPAAGPVAAPALGALAIDAAELSALRYRAPSGYVVRELRGPKMHTTMGVFDEFAAAFQFPYYFGENKDAFDECLRDLDDFVGEAAGYVAVIRIRPRYSSSSRTSVSGSPRPSTTAPVTGRGGTSSSVSFSKANRCFRRPLR